MKKRVVVTGMGAITPIGLSVEEFWSNVKKGVTGFDFISKFDASEYKCKIAAEVKVLMISTVGPIKNRYFTATIHASRQLLLKRLKIPLFSSSLTNAWVTRIPLILSAI